VVRPSQARDTNHLLLRNGDGGVLDCWFGRYGDRILVGDRNADGVWAPAAVRSGTWTLRETHAPDSPVATLSFGRSGDRYLAGDWTTGPRPSWQRPSWADGLPQRFATSHTRCVTRSPATI
jgi:hypothetical protein